MTLFGRPSEKDSAREMAYRQWFARQHPLALASLLLSAFSLTHFGTLWVDEVLGIALGVATLVQTGRARQQAAAASTADVSNCPRCRTDLARRTDRPGYCPDCGRAVGGPRSEGRWLAWAGIGVGLLSLTCAVLVYFVLKPRH